MPEFDNETDGKSHLLAAMAGEKNSIENMEAAGQGAMVRSADLPIEIQGVTLEEVADHTGIKFGEPVNELFIAAELPPGWEKKATDHSMHSDLVDQDGRKRAGIFYKAAFYDRRAFMHFYRFYDVTNDYEEAPNFDLKGCDVKDANGNLVKRFDTKSGDSYGNDAQTRADAWLDKHYVDWKNPWAYWDTSERATA